MRSGLGVKTKWIVAALGLSALTGCSATGEGGVGSMLLSAGATEPAAQAPSLTDVYCPPVTVSEGGAAIQAYSGGRVGDANALRSQVALGELARECVGQPDGSIAVKVGVEARALLGAGGGGAGRVDVPVQIVVKSGSRVFATRSRRMALSIPAGQAQGSATVVEENIVVPPADANSFEIEVSLGGQGTGRRRG
jgi:hypothetical protein